VSLILDALNRSRSEAEAVPGLGTQHPVEPVAGGGRRYLPWIALGVAVLVIVVLLLDRVLNGAGDPEQAAPPAGAVSDVSRNVSSALTSVKSELQARAAERQPGTASEPEPAPAAKPQPAADGEAETEPAPAAEREPATAAQSAPGPDSGDEVAQLYRRGNAEAAAAPQTPATQTTPAAQPKEAAQPTEEAIDIEQVLARAQEQLNNERLADHPAPFLASLSQQTKDQIPTIFYQRHDYDDRGGRSSVVMNKKTLQVGGSPAPGVRIDEILPDSTMFTCQGTQFRLRALNSWVNL